jgi:biopolymer transport protein ExbB
MNLNLFFEGFVKLGWMGIPLLLTSLAAVAICAERTAFFLRNRLNRALVYRWVDEHTAGHADPEDAPRSSPLWQLLLAFRDHASLPEEKRRRCCEAAILSWVHRARAPIKHLAVLAQVAPLLGLTGTVLGLVEAFRVLEKNERMASPSLLAGGIWEALLTTVVGMLIAIPLIIIVRAFNGRIDQTVTASRELFADLEKREFSNTPPMEKP